MPWISPSFACDWRRVFRRLPAVALLFVRAFVRTDLRFLAAPFLLVFFPFFPVFFLVVFLPTFLFFATFFVAPAFLRTGFFLAAVFLWVFRFGAAFLGPDFAVPRRVREGFLEAFFLAVIFSALRDLFKTRNYTYGAPHVKGFSVFFGGCPLLVVRLG